MNMRLIILRLFENLIQPIATYSNKSLQCVKSSSTTCLLPYKHTVVGTHSVVKSTTKSYLSTSKDTMLKYDFGKNESHPHEI